jgi:hypothetical protein
MTPSSDGGGKIKERQSGQNVAEQNGRQQDAKAGPQ